MVLGGIGSANAQDETFHPQDFWDQPRSIWMSRATTGEEIKATYWADGDLVLSGYLELCWFMRDVQLEKQVRSLQAHGATIPKSLNPATNISLVLLDILYATGGWLDYHGMSRSLVLTSGFRHPITNARTEGAAQGSHHTRGGAGDLLVPGVSPEAVSAFGRWLSRGGVGWYPGKAFTHVDDGRLRFWRG